LYFQKTMSDNEESRKDFIESSSFDSLPLKKWLKDQCRLLGFEHPTPVQHTCIPRILEGQDILACAKTGSGKTAAFALPILDTLSDDVYGIFALVLTPTRELAYQIADQFRVFGKPLGLKDCVITGGMDMMIQNSSLTESPHIVIATPGRLADHIESGTEFSLNKIKFLVLDEADRLLEDNFGKQLQTIFSILPKQRQTLLFSATITDTIKKVQSISERKPFVFDGNLLHQPVEKLDQYYLLVPANVKDAYLFHLLSLYHGNDDDDGKTKKHSTSTIVFTSTCRDCQILSMMCRKFHMPSVEIHSLMKQRQRLASLAKFKSLQVRILFATDVASRGLDIPSVDLIINHNVPFVPKEYVHRVGRTARAGRCGTAITLVTQYDVKLMHKIEERIDKQLTEYRVKEKEVLKLLVEVSMTRSQVEIQLDEEDFGEAEKINKRKHRLLEQEILAENHPKEKKSKKKRNKSEE
jgi:ATP-dependent RNA helicase DDX49/DBP8